MKLDIKDIEQIIEVALKNAIKSVQGKDKQEMKKSTSNKEGG